MAESERGLDFDLGGSALGVKQVGLLLGMVFAVTLGIMVARQMSAEAMAVIVGVVCGVAAGIPTSVLMFLLTTHGDRPREDEPNRRAKEAVSPPVVVIQGGSPHALPQGMPAGYWPASSPGPPVPREFRVVGGDELIIDG